MTEPTDPVAPAKRKAAPRKRKPSSKPATKKASTMDASPSADGNERSFVDEANEPVVAPVIATSRQRSDPVRDESTQPTVNLIRVAMPVRWRDLDAFNHVNNSKYLSYLEEARLQWMLTLPGHGMDDHVAPVVAAAQLSYRRPIAWPNEVAIELFVERLGSTSVTVGHRIVSANQDEVLFCDGNVVLVWIDRDSGRAAPLPEAVRRACSG